MSVLSYNCIAGHTVHVWDLLHGGRASSLLQLLDLLQGCMLRGNLALFLNDAGIQWSHALWGHAYDRVSAVHRLMNV